MTLIADGSYLILSRQDTSYALMVNGNADYNGASILMYKRFTDIGDSQLINVVTHENGYQSIRFPTTGKCFCIAGGALFNENYVHQWVFHDDHVSAQYPDGDHRCLWTVELLEGQTETVNGVSYPVYTIRSAKDRNYAIHIYWAVPRNNQPMCICETADPTPAVSTQAQWVFIPVNALQKAVYRLASRVNQDACIGIAEGANGAGSNVYIVGNQDSNSQRWIAVEDTGYKLVNAENGKLMRATAASDGANVELSEVVDSYSKWSFNFVESDMEKLTNFSIAVQEGQGYVLDAANGEANGSAIGTNLEVYHNWGGQNQRWTAVMESLYDKNVKAVSDLGVSESIGSSRKNLFGTREAISVWPSFVGSEQSYQMRYRWRGKKLGSSTFNEWSSWMSIADDSSAFSGWGSEFSPNATLTKSNDRYWSDKAILVEPSPSGYYVREIEVSVRGWTPKAQNAYISDYPGHGSASTASFIVGWKPSLSVSSVSFRPKGIAIEYTSDLKTGGVSITIDSMTADDKTIAKNQNGTLDSDGTIAYVPYSFVPNENASIEMHAHLITSEGIESEPVTYTGRMPYASGQTSSISPTVEITEIGLAYVSVPNVAEEDNVSICVQYEGKDAFERYNFDTSTKSAAVPIQYGVPYTIWVLWESADGAHWSIWSQSYPVLEDPHLYMFVFSDEDGTRKAFAIKLNVNEHPTISRSLSPDFDSYTTMGDQYETVSYSGAIPESITIGGVLMPMLEEFYSTTELLEEFTEAGYAYFRAPKMKTVMRVAVTNVSLDDTHPDYTTASITVKRIG